MIPRPSPQGATTPGPWHVEDPLGPGILSIVAGGPEVYDWLHVAQLSVDAELDEMSDEEVIPEAQVWANARLIAAAPAMRDALQALDDFWTAEHPAGPEGDPTYGIGTLSAKTLVVWRNIRSALALARGAAPDGGANPEEKL